MAESVVITAYENGPYVVKGKAKILDADGHVYEVGEKPSVALCRCGASRNKPFCDGTHSKIGFEAAERATSREEPR